MSQQQQPGYEQVSFSVDLVEASLRELDLLSEVDRHAVLLTPGGAAVRRAIRRYEQCWLPLAARQPSSESLAPALDVHWVWHCHMLAPYSYESDVTRLVGTVVSHRLMTRAELDKARARTKSLWTAAYPHEPYDVDLTASSANDSTAAADATTNYTSLCGYDLEAAVGRQAKFYYQVSLPHYRNVHFLKQAATRYKKFLHLKRVAPDAFLVPCYDFDLVWHAHQLHPVNYRADTSSMLGRMFNHDDTINDRAPGSKLSESDAKTRQLWKDNYKEDFAAAGAMFRGDTPRNRLRQMSADAVYAVSTKTATVTINSLRLDNVEPTHKFVLKVTLVTNTEDVGRRGRRRQQNQQPGSMLLKLKGPRTEWPDHADHGAGIARFVFDTGAHSALRFELVDKKGFMCFGGEQISGAYHYPLRQVVETTYTSGRHISQTVSLQHEDQQSFSDKSSAVSAPAAEPLVSGGRMSADGHPSVSFSASVEAPKRGTCTLTLEAGQFETCTMPENVDQLWGPVALPSLPAGVPNTCIVASHRLLNDAQQLMFTCRVVHSIPLLMSAVQVFYTDQMVAVSHLIGIDQLPTSKMVGEDNSCPHLNSADGERALLIKDNIGDWGIVHGKWLGFRKGVPGKPESYLRLLLANRTQATPSIYTGTITHAQLCSISTTQ